MSATACRTTQAVDRENGAEPLGDVQKGARREQPAVVGAQPEEQLVLADLVGREIEDGLAEQLELIVRERALNALGLRQPRRCSRLARRTPADRPRTGLGPLPSPRTWRDRPPPESRCS